MSFKSCVAVVMFSVFCITPSVFAGETVENNNQSDAVTSIPRSLTYQGILKDILGDPVANDSKSVIFRIYDAPSDGDLEWSQTIGISTDGSGYFTAVLSNLNIPFDEDYWLELEMDSEILTPRQQLNMTAYAARADTADYAFAALGGGSSNWNVSDSVLYTNSYLGVSRGGADNMLYGDSVHTMVNIGVACTTGTDGSNYYYSTINGGYGNFASSIYNTISGGDHNYTSSGYSTIGGGGVNQATGIYSLIGGGWSNQATGGWSTIGGGNENQATNSWSTVCGGDGNVAGGRYSTIGGGLSNNSSSNNSTVSGGAHNDALGSYNTIGGGFLNTASDTSTTIGGGYFNEASGLASTISGGEENIASGEHSTVGGGQENTASSGYSTVGGGYSNSASNITSTVSGGYSNAASGMYSSVAGGRDNEASGQYSFAAGRRAKASYSGTFVWGDNTDADFTSTANNQFLIRASGGVGIGGNSPMGALDITQDADEVCIHFTNGARDITWMPSHALQIGQWDGTTWTQRMKIASNGYVSIGDSDPSYKLDVDGDINCSGSYNVKKGGVNYNHPDYVFEPDYDLMAIDDLKKFVKANKHLPNVISADDVRQNNGFKLDELLIQMLEKIEEQTLYIIQLDEKAKEIDQLKAENAKLKSEIEALMKLSN